ncbi:sensor domain-containing diguanylate cyclase [Alteribacter populi]|uniref:sensor domain-containing diguanylate cyclase n=1 Tax=Alteribacter populi TaxID=2011011 RepID=UPI000BBA9799|nr:sensor domain-containing diguanylate cyclase [Alteribacter populi]
MGGLVVAEENKQSFWVLWFLVFPIFIYLFYEHIVAFSTENVFAVIAFSVLILLVSLFPIRIKSTSLIPLHGISLAVFLQFGIIVEMAVTQLALFTALSRIKLSKKELFRIPLNSLIFLSTSALAAGAFYLLGGSTGNVDRMTFFNDGIPIIGYAVTYFFSNHILIYFAIKYMTKKEHNFWDEDLRWEAISAVMIVPVGLILTMMYNQIGFIAILLMSVPFICVSLILKQFHNTKQTNKLLTEVSAYGYRINENLPVRGIIELFFEHVKAIFPVDRIYLYERNDNQLKLKDSFHPDSYSEMTLLYGDAVSKKVVHEGRSVHYDARRQWETQGQYDNYPNTHSIISVPVMRNHEAVGVITLTSERKRAFEKRHVMILEFMANYLGVAIQNARNYAQKKQESERCALTNLYNFRYFENLLLEKFDESKSELNERQLAIILIDLDHFKRVNDTYGHHSGNEVLCQVADLLEETVGHCGTVARYGGEEFVVLIEGTNLTVVESMAESLRLAIENHIFIVEDDLKERKQTSIQVTASIGVAGKTEPGESAMAVLRNADRAMYTGAKQQGRNRVAQFS